MENDTTKRIGAVIKTRRMELRLSQEKLAKESGLSINTIQRAESGEHPMSSLTEFSLARVFGWPDDAFDRLRNGEHPSTFEPTPVDGPEPAATADAAPSTKSDVAVILNALNEMRHDNASLRADVDELSQMHGQVLVRVGRLERQVAALTA